MNDTSNLAIFCDFENVAIGARESNFQNFDIGLVLARLLDKGRVLVKKAYCDWERYKNYRRQMHEAGFELLEVPHISYSGKNSADIYLVCDALDLSYNRDYIDTVVIISGDSDFSPLVRKLRENNKTVIGVGVKNSSSDLLIENVDEFIYYDDLVRRKKGRGGKGRGGKGRGTAKPTNANAKADPKADPKANGAKQSSNAPADPTEKLGDPMEAIELVLDTLEALFGEKDDNIWGSHVKQVIKRKRPNFDESYFGYRTFSELLEDAEKRKFVSMVKDDKSGGYVITGFGDEA